MKFFYDLFPIAIFFVVYKMYDLYWATAALIVLVVLQVFTTLICKKRLEMMHVVTLAMITLLGGATLLFKNEMFIKWKPTAVYWILALVFAGSQWIGKKNLVQKMLEKSLSIPAQAWTRLNITWYSFFLIMGLLNLIVVYSFDTNTWVNFKLFGTLALTLIFVILQGILIARYLPPHASQAKSKKCNTPH